MKCQVCSRVKVQGSVYCVYHEAARANLVKEFASWELAYGSIDWERYLESVSELSESGDWVRELASHELELIKYQK